MNEGTAASGAQHTGHSTEPTWCQLPSRASSVCCSCCCCCTCSWCGCCWGSGKGRHCLLLLPPLPLPSPFRLPARLLLLPLPCAQLRHSTARDTHLDVPVDAPVFVHILQPLQHKLHDGGNRHLVQALQDSSSSSVRSKG